MAPRCPPFAGLADVRITRDGDTATLHYAGEPAMTVRLALGTAARRLSDQEILDLHNQRLFAVAERLVGAPQVVWDERGGCWRPHGRVVACGCWRPHGRVVACAVEAGAGLDEPLVAIDDLELSLAELGRMLAGHGAPVRILFVDE